MRSLNSVPGIDKICLWLIVICAAAMRLWELDIRPLHADEAVNYQFAKELLERGFYPYSHKNFHGPVLFYAIAASFNLFGISEHTLRLPAILASAILIVCVWNVFSQEDRFSRVMAGALCAFSPSLVYFGRYGIHESLLCLGTAWLVLCLRRSLEGNSRCSLYGASLALALMATAKETWIIHVVAIGLALIASYSPQKLFGLMAQRGRGLFFPFLLWAIVLLLTYSALFLYPQGIKEFFLGYFKWIQRGVSGSDHAKDFSYYAEVILKTEAYLVIAVLIGLGRVLFYGRFQKPWTNFLLWWSLFTLLIYSSIPYKTPWVIINMTLPLALFTASLLSRETMHAAFHRSPNGGLILRASISFGLLLGAALLCYRYNFVNPIGKGNPFSYMHTQKGTLEFVSYVKGIMKENPRAKIAVNLANPWPLPFYLRDFYGSITYMQPLPDDIFSQDYDIVVTDRSLPKEVPATLHREYEFSDFIFGRVYVQDDSFCLD